uniref:Uncharacterized protein n=1 Tax=Rhizophora mucronata TaxID=61149 RepID=A0A2P2MCD3_RHIMU
MTIRSFFDRASRVLHGDPACSRLLVLLALRFALPLLYKLPRFDVRPLALFRSFGFREFFWSFVVFFFLKTLGAR